MKKLLLSLLFIIATAMSYAQVGVGTTNINPSTSLTVGANGISIDTNGDGTVFTRLAAAAAPTNCNVSDTAVHYGAAHARCLALADGSYMPTMKELMQACGSASLTTNYWVADANFSVGNNAASSALVFRPDTSNFITTYSGTTTHGSICVK